MHRANALAQASDQYLLEGLKRLCEAALAEVRRQGVARCPQWQQRLRQRALEMGSMACAPTHPPLLLPLHR
jgi:hypothetical protein